MRRRRAGRGPGCSFPNAGRGRRAAGLMAGAVSNFVLQSGVTGLRRRPRGRFSEAKPAGCPRCHFLSDTPVAASGCRRRYRRRPAGRPGARLRAGFRQVFVFQRPGRQWLAGSAAAAPGTARIGSPRKRRPAGRFFARGKVPSLWASQNWPKNSPGNHDKRIDGKKPRYHGLWSPRLGTTSCCGQQRVNNSQQLLVA
jgi:hypothetical protein